MSLLVGLIAFGKDYASECNHLSARLLAGEYGKMFVSNKEYAERFADHYRKASESHHIFVYQDGNVDFDGTEMSGKDAVRQIDNMSVSGEREIALLIGGTYSKKADKTISRLYKSIYSLVETRDKSGISYNEHPVLVTMRYHYKDVMGLLAEPPVESQAQRNDISPEQVEEMAAAEVPVAAAYEHEPAARTSAPQTAAQTQKPSTEDSGGLASGMYIVNVNSSLSVRRSPSTSGAKIGALSNGSQVEVLESVGGWARIAYEGSAAYVKADYLEAVLAEEATSNNYDRGLWRGILYAVPFLILVLAIISFFAEGTLFTWSVVALGFVELLYAAAEQHVSLSSALPWFCTPEEVGWIWTVVNFGLLVVVLFFQHEVFKGMVGGMLDASGRSGLGFVFSFVAFYILLAVVGIMLVSGLMSLRSFWIPLLALALLWVVVKFMVGDSFFEVLPLTLMMAVACGGFLVFFLKTAGVLVIGGLIYICVSAFAGSSSASDSSKDSSSPSGGGQRDHGPGTIETDAFGGKRIRHGDGSVTDVHDYGGDIVDNDGKHYRRGIDGRVHKF